MGPCWGHAGQQGSTPGEGVCTPNLPAPSHHGLWLLPQVQAVTKSPSGLLEVTVTSSAPGHKPTMEVIRDVDCLLWAVGREPNSKDLCLDRVVRWEHVSFPLGITIFGLHGQSFSEPCGTMKSVAHLCWTRFLHPETLRSL